MDAELEALVRKSELVAPVEIVADMFKTWIDQMQFRTLEDVMADPLRVDVPPKYRGQVE